MAKSQRQEAAQQDERLGCLGTLFSWIIRGILRMFGIGRQEMRKSLKPLDELYREFVDSWVSENLARWLNQTRPEIDVDRATKVMLGQANTYPDVARQIRETLIDAKVTFSQRNGKQYLEIEAYMTARQVNGKLPQILRWNAEREIAWQDIPDDVRERLIRARQPVTLAYAIPE